MLSKYFISTILGTKYNYKMTNNYNLINTNYTKDITLEFLWSIAPLIILLIIVGPSLGLLYSSSLLNNNNFYKPDITIKIVGAMWY